jgi:hypothetical protein
MFNNGTLNTLLDCAHKASFGNEEAVLQSVNCGCFYCCEIYKASEVHEFVSVERSAACPRCLVDAVLPDQSGYPLHPVFLKMMRMYWFGR